MVQAPPPRTTSCCAITVLPRLASRQTILRTVLGGGQVIAAASGWTVRIGSVPSSSERKPFRFVLLLPAQARRCHERRRTRPPRGNDDGRRARPRSSRRHSSGRYDCGIRAVPACPVATSRRRCRRAESTCLPPRRVGRTSAPDGLRLLPNRRCQTADSTKQNWAKPVVACNDLSASHGSTCAECSRHASARPSCSSLVYT